MALLRHGFARTMGHDTLSEVLRNVRLRGAVFYHVEGEPPWVAEAPPAADIADAIMPGVEHVMEYHVVTRGRCWAALLGEPPVQLEPGDVVVFPRGDPHVMSSAPGMRARPPVEAFRQPRPKRLPFYLVQRGASPVEGRASAGSDATLLCGFFGCDARPFNPLLASLPRLMRLTHAAGSSRETLSGFVTLALAEAEGGQPGGQALLERLSEMLFVEVVRQHLAALPEGQSDWLAGLRDRYVGRALALLHERPAETWTIERLASLVGLSRSALHERFARMTGHAPMQYLARWRMQLAATKLRESKSSVASVAADVGYESEAAFSRAFRRAVGESPAAWRRSR
jgi:AraC-like DNA-binding protein